MKILYCISKIIIKTSFSFLSISVINFLDWQLAKLQNYYNLALQVYFAYTLFSDFFNWSFISFELLISNIIENGIRSKNPKNIIFWIITKVNKITSYINI